MSTPSRELDATLPAEIYDTRFVPALFGPWAVEIARTAGIEAGHDVLDVGCGTGALACHVASSFAGAGTVTGLDPNEAMLEVARGKPEPVRWVNGQAEALPFEAHCFDRVVSQFAMMFFEDAVQALREMRRVLRPEGRLVVAVCDGLDHSPGYAVLTELLHRLFGSLAAESFRAPFSLGDRSRLSGLAREAGLDGARVQRREGRVGFRSIADLVSTERACAWTLGGVLDDAQFQRLSSEAEESLRPFTDEAGALAFDVPALTLEWG